MADYLTAALPGTGGLIRQQPADFLVEEIPLYTPSGSGDHLYLEIEKQGLTTFDAIKLLARALKRNEADIGYAGLKDARAVSRQTLSVPLCAPAEVAGLDLPGLRILSARRHGNKLRTGHLAGNRFRIRIRQPVPDAVDRARPILAALEDLGVPNRFGEQRYGVLGNSARIGRAILRGDFQQAADEIVGDPARIEHPGWQTAATAYRAGDLATAVTTFPRHCQDERRLVASLQSGRTPRRAVLALPRRLLRLYLSAWQSSLFDRLVAMRLTTLERLWPGDLACKHVNGACFKVIDPAIEQSRADRLQISATAPLYGYKVPLADGQAGLLETSLLDKEGLTLESFRLSGGLALPGERRPIRVPLTGTDLQQAGDDLLVSFALPKGSFATAVLAEIMKTAEPVSDTEQEAP
ncbi:MAG: tRNA pseudouridine(13) synthase TruD [Desulfuromonadales bacterium]|nr:tRNA pseudouridine(13) synthase TruD [Desulfuromonadales bacterium]